MQSTLKNTEQLCGGYALQTIEQAKRLVEDLKFQRQHPFLSEWKEWQEVVQVYHSVITKNFCTAINRGRWKNLPGHSLFCDAAEKNAFWINKGVDHRIIEILEERKQFNGKVEDIEIKSMSYLFPTNCSCICYEDEVMCEWKQLHLVTNILVAIWARYVTKYHRRSERKYFERLQRIVLSLPYDKLRKFDVDLINNPPRYKGRGRNLLREMYSRAYFDGFKVNDIATQIEFLKHFRTATEQCNSGCYIDKVVAIAKEQGFSHDINLSDAAVVKIQNLIKESQDNFMTSLSKTLMMSAKQIMVMFLMATTIGLLARVAAGITLTLVVKILNLIYSFLVPGRSKSYAVQQDGGNKLSIPLLPALVTDYVIAPPTAIATKLWKNPNVDLAMRRIGYIGDPKIHNGIDTLLEWSKQMIYKVINWFRCEILGILPIEDLESQSCQLDSWNLECDDLIKSYYSNEMVWTDSTWSILMSLYSRGISFTRSPVYSRYKNDIWKVVQKLGNLLEKFSQRMRSNNSVRNPPVTIYMCGDSGVGKSSVTYPFAVEILKGIFTREKSPIDLAKQWKNMIYMRSAEQEFWDGYENQLVTVFDDFNQLIDSSSTPNVELFEIIRASNCFPYPLHMAALDQKANTTFNSKIILASSNLQKPKTASLNFPSALYRRFDICVRVTRKSTAHTDQFDPSLFEFQLYNMVTEQLGDFIGYKELVLLAVESYFKRRGFVDSVDKYIMDTLKDYKVAQEQGVMEVMYSCRSAVNNVKGFVKETCKSFRDFLNPASLKNIFYDMREGVEHIKQSASDRTKWWEVFKTDHRYLISAASFVGILSICYAVVRTIISLTHEEKKENIMTMRQFTRVLTEGKPRITSESIKEFGPKNAKVESIKESNVKMVKVESIKEATPKTVKVESIKESIPPKVVKAESIAQQEGVLDVNASEILMKVVRNNVYKIKDCTTDNYIGHVLFLRGRVCLMPHHYIHALDNLLDRDVNGEIEFDGIMLSRSFRMKVVDLVNSLQSFESPPEGEEVVISRDLMHCEVSSAIFHSDVTNLFVPRASVQYVSNVKAYLPVLVTNDLKKSTRPVLMVKFVQGKSQISVVDELMVTTAADQPMRRIRSAWSYQMDTKPTECGAPLIVRNPLITPGKICGIHVAGSDQNGEGFSTPIYKEDIEKIISCYDFVPFLKNRLELGPVKEQGMISEDAQFIPLGTLKQSVVQPTKSKIKRSLVYGKIREPKTRPCLLFEANIDGQVFNPRKYRLEKLGKESVAISQGLIDVSGEALEDFMLSKLSHGLGDPTIKSVYSYNEAVKGIDGSLYVNSLKRSSSPGFPFIQMPGFLTKTQIYGDGEDFDLDRPQSKRVEQMVMDIITSAKENEVLDHYFCDTLKDERKPIFKSHKTRLFSAGSLDYLIACKMYFNGIVALIESNKNFCGISVGSNVYSQDWNNISRLLLQKSDKILAGDFEGFDASQHMSLLLKCGDILINLSRRLLGSTEEDCKIMKILLVSLFNSKHIMGNEVYQWTHSLPSGHYLTAIINSVFVLLVFGMVWSIGYDNTDYYFIRMFYEECGIVAYGDDHVVSVPSNRISVLNQYRLPEYFKQIGLSYTLEEKEAIVSGFSRKLQEVQFLKRHFYYHKKLNRVIGPLSMDTILETPMWMHSCPDARAQTIENLEWAIRELSLHRKEVWDEWFPVFEKLLISLGHYTTFKKKEEVLTLVLE